MAFVTTLLMMYLLKAENQRRDAGVRDEVISDKDAEKSEKGNGVYESVEEAKRQRGDKWSGYRYIL